MSERVLGRIVGHMTSIGLLRQEILSIVGAVDCFIHLNYDDDDDDGVKLSPMLCEESLFNDCCLLCFVVCVSSCMMK